MESSAREFPRNTFRYPHLFEEGKQRPKQYRPKSSKLLGKLQGLWQAGLDEFVLDIGYLMLEFPLMLIVVAMSRQPRRMSLIT